MGAPSVAAFFLGGTISYRGPEGGSERLGAAELLHDLRLGGIEVVHHDVRRVPSAALSLSDVTDLLARARGVAEDGIVVVQGTDTLEETAFLADLMWDDDRPLVLTGAMRHASSPGPDGAANLVAAIRVAASRDFAGAGALVVLNDEVHAARFVRKEHRSGVAAFASPNAGPLGFVTEGAAVRTWTHERTAVHAPAAAPAGRVPILTLALGEDPDLVRALGAAADGLVVAALGAGHVPPDFVGPLEALAARIPVVLSSRVRSGPVLRATYTGLGSESDLLDRGLIGAGLLDPVKSRLLLLVGLACGHDRATLARVFAETGGA